MIPSERQAPTIARRQLAEVTRAVMVAADSRAACSQDLPLARLATAAAVSGSQRYCNLRIDDHSSAHGMPNARSALHTTFCVRSFAGMTSVSSAMSSSRDAGVAACSGPAPEIFNSTGFWTSVETSLAPAREGYGDAPGPTAGRSPIESASAAWEQSSRAALLSVGFSTGARQRTEAVCPPRNAAQL